MQRFIGDVIAQQQNAKVERYAGQFLQYFWVGKEHVVDHQDDNAIIPQRKGHEDFCEKPGLNPMLLAK